MHDKMLGKEKGKAVSQSKRQEASGKNCITWQVERHMASGKARQGEDKGTEFTVISSFMSLLGIPSENSLSKFFSKILN